MTRNLKALGLVFFAVFAMSAVVASAAQATNATFSWPETTKHLTGVADPTDPAQKRTLTAGKFAFECNVVTGEATVTGTSAESAEIKNVTLSHTEKPADTCKGPLNVNASINFNGCALSVKGGTTLKEAPSGEAEGTGDIVCPAGKEITTEAPGCMVRIPPQTGLGPIYARTVKTGAKEEVTAEIKVGLVGGALHNKGAKYFHSGFTCGTGSGEDGTFDGKITIKGYSADKTTQTDVTVT